MCQNQRSIKERYQQGDVVICQYLIECNKKINKEKKNSI